MAFSLGKLKQEDLNEYPFGMIMEGRSFTSENYRFGFNGKENDNTVNGRGTQQDYGNRIYNTRIGRFLSIDPITSKFAYLTPYQFASNRTIDGFDLDGLEYATFTILVVDGNVTEISVTKDYELKNEETKGPGIQYNYIYVNSVENTIQTKTEFKKNLYGIYQGGENPQLPKKGQNPNKLYDDYSLEPIDEADANAKQHDLDFDLDNLSGLSGILDDRSTPANVKYIKNAKKIEEKYKRQENDAVTNKAITKQAVNASTFGKKWFKRFESLKGNDENGNKKTKLPREVGPKN
ncbi:MAG: hypothetical protein EYC69_09775 [Bacteroidetes bacterium]|nr:MAG: hypothetical protein EYC69_09775 [Bacteroidota bacterium]